MARWGDLLAKGLSGQELTPDELQDLRQIANSLQSLVGLAQKVDPATGAIDQLTAGTAAEIGKSGIRLYDRSPTVWDEDATIKWKDTVTGNDQGTIGAHGSASTTLSIYSNSDHGANPQSSHGELELMAAGNGTQDWETWLYLIATGDWTGQQSVIETYVGIGGSYKTPFRIYHNFTSRESLFVFLCSKATTGDPSGEEGMLYYNTFDNAIKMYADGAWRTLASW